MTVSVRLASFSIGSTANGADNADIATLSISTDGTTFVDQVSVNGNSNVRWDFTTGVGVAIRSYSTAATTAFTPAASGDRTTDGYSTLSVTGIPGTAQLRVRVTLKNDDTKERWIIDDLKIIPSVVLTDVLIPQYMQGITVSPNTDRLPYVFRAALSNLTPNATYRYYSQAIKSTDAATLANASGNAIFVPLSGSFVRSTTYSLSSGYGSLTASASGTYTGWFVVEPTGAATFTVGNTLKPVVILNDGAGGTTATVVLPTTATASVVQLGTTSTQATGVYGISAAPAKSFVFSYNNTGGTGRPLSGSFVEDDGTANATGNYAAFYGTSVDAQVGRFGFLTPNTNAAGIQRLEQRALSDGSMVCANTDADGVWPSNSSGSANTVNPHRRHHAVGHHRHRCPAGPGHCDDQRQPQQRGRRHGRDHCRHQFHGGHHRHLQRYQCYPY